MRKRRTSTEVLLSRPLPQSKPQVAPALSFCVEGWTFTQTASLLKSKPQHGIACGKRRRSRPNRVRRCPLLSLAEVGAPGSRAEVTAGGNPDLAIITAGPSPASEAPARAAACSALASFSTTETTKGTPRASGRNELGAFDDK